MNMVVEFPGLGLSFDISRVAFQLFGVNIYKYGVLIGLGVFLAFLFVFQQSKRFGVDSDRLVDVVTVGLISGVVGARAYYVLFVSTLEYENFFQVINIRDGGLAIYGGVIFGFLGAFVASKWRKVPVLPVFDLVGMGFLIGQAFGRWGNFFNQEAFGGNTTLPWGMISPATISYLQMNAAHLSKLGVTVDPFQPVHPTFLYESIWCVIGFFLLFAWRKRRHFNGEIALFYVMWYGLGRFFIEGLRTDPLLIGSLRVSQVVAALSVLAAFGIWIAARMRTAGKPLQIPALPPRTEMVKLTTDSGIQKVEITWPGADPVPSKAEKIKLAEAVLAEQETTASKAESGKSEEEDSASPAKDEAEPPATETEDTAASPDEDTAETL